MSAVLQVIMVFILLFIFAEDIRSNAVYWFWFPMLAAAAFAVKWFLPAAGIFLSIGVNMGFLAVQFILMFFWFTIRRKQPTWKLESLIGLGDILFLVSVGFYLSALNFLIFYVSSLVFTIIVWLAWQWCSRASQVQVPLAGLQSLFLIALMGLDWQSKTVDLLDDSWLLTITGL